MKFTAALLILASMATASPLAKLNPWKRANLDMMDMQIVNLARNLESLELNLWNQGLDNFTDSDFNDAGFPNFRPFLTLFRDQETQHFTALNNALNGGFKNCTYKFPISTPAELISVGQVVTSVGEGAFLGALGNISDPASRQLAGEIIGNEARQNSYLRQTGGLDFFSAVNFDTPLTASQAYSLAKPFLFCPSSNPPINFPVIPPLTAAFDNPTKPHNGGDNVKVMWDPSAFYLGQDVHINFLSDMYSIASPLKQNGDNTGMGMTQLPVGINGTSFLVATNYDAGGPIPDAENFAIGYLVVA